MTDSYVQIDLSALRDNVREILKKYPDYRSVIAVVKGDAYGHGMRASTALREGGVSHFAVSSLEEARKLREYVDSDILCLEPIEIARLDEAAELGLTLPVSDLEYLNELISASGDHSFKLHMQIDTGFNRLGFKNADEIARAAELIDDSSHTLEGMYQHFATAGIFDPHYDEQIKRFTELTAQLDTDRIPLVHLSSGVTMLAHPKPDAATAARMGLLMYGYNIAPRSYDSGISNTLRKMRDSYYRKKYSLTPTINDVELSLTPAMSYKCRILQLKRVSKGEHVGYGAAYTAGEDQTIAILPVGYNNGIGHQNNGRTVDINGELYPVIGVIGMNMMAVRVDDSVKLSDTVTLLGGKVTLGMFSRSSGLGLAEALLSIGKNNPRIYYNEKQQL